MKVIGTQVGWGFWLKWVLASTVGVVIGFIMMIVIGLLVPELFEIEWFDLLVAGIVIGIGVGVLQWLVLRRRITGAGWWVLASAAAGAAVIWQVDASYDDFWFGTLLRFTVVVALGGAVAGILQWLVLRSQVSRAGWWVLASTVSWGLGMTMLGAGMVAPPSNLWGTTGIPEILLIVGSGAVLGAVTGAALVWLLRQPVTEA